MDKADYGLLLEPHLAERVWGGDILGAGIGEAWDLSVHENGVSRIANGPLAGRPLSEVVDERTDDFGGPVELLAKRLDARADLSVQVHPRKGDPKTEAWVVLQADRNAGVYHGFDEPVTREQIRAAAEDGSLPRRMRFVEVQCGQCVFVPSGTVHAIGAGLFLFELQQSSDTTYRLFDWGRGRELHLEEGLPHCDLEGAPPLPVPKPRADGSLRLVECDYFTIDRVDTTKPHALDPGPKWIAVLVVAGSATVAGSRAGPGRTVLLPKAAGPAHLEPERSCTALVYGPCRGQ